MTGLVTHADTSAVRAFTLILDSVILSLLGHELNEM